MERSCGKERAVEKKRTCFRCNGSMFLDFLSMKGNQIVDM